jgi:hypothetical protein
MLQFGGKPNKSSSSDSKRHFTVIMGGKEHGRYVSSTPSSAAKKAVTKLCASNKSKKVEFHIREITQGSKKKTYGPYIGYIEKLNEPVELKGRIIKYKPVAKLIGNSGSKKGGAPKEEVPAQQPPVNPFNFINNNIGNPAEGPAPVGIYNYVPNNSRYSAAFPEPSAPRLENINRNNFRNPLEGIVATAPVFDNSNNFNNPAAGPARAGPAQQHSNDNGNNPFFPFPKEFGNIEFPYRKKKARNPHQLNSLIEFVKFIEKWKISWNNSKSDDFFDDFFKKFKFDLQDMSQRDRENRFHELKYDLLRYLNNYYSLDRIKRYIHKTITNKPNWIKFVKDSRYLPLSDAKHAQLLKNFSSNSEFIVLSSDNNVNGPKKRIPAYKSKNYGKTLYMRKKNEPQDVIDYKIKLNNLARELYKNLINWYDRSGIIDRSVKYLLDKHYISPTDEQVFNAIQTVRMFLAPTRNREIYKKIMENTFD